MKNRMPNLSFPKLLQLLSILGGVLMILVIVGGNPISDWVFELLDDKVVWKYKSFTVDISWGGLKIWFGIVIMNLIIYFFWKKREPKELYTEDKRNKKSSI